MREPLPSCPRSVAAVSTAGWARSGQALGEAQEQEDASVSPSRQDAGLVPPALNRLPMQRQAIRSAPTRSKARPQNWQGNRPTRAARSPPSRQQRGRPTLPKSWPVLRPQGVGPTKPAGQRAGTGKPGADTRRGTHSSRGAAPPRMDAKGETITLPRRPPPEKTNLGRRIIQYAVLSNEKYCACIFIVRIHRSRLAPVREWEKLSLSIEIAHRD
jgi:hypothetical protein